MGGGGSEGGTWTCVLTDDAAGCHRIVQTENGLALDEAHKSDDYMLAQYMNTIILK